MKAVLLIDIPDDLTMEDLEVYGEISSNRIDDGWVRELRKEDLKPMPKPKEFTPLDAYEHDKDIYVYGWNACLKEIENETDRH